MLYFQVFLLHSPLNFILFAFIEHVRSFVLFPLDILVLKGITLEFGCQFVIIFVSWGLLLLRLLRFLSKSSQILLLLFSRISFLFVVTLLILPLRIRHCTILRGLLTALNRSLTLLWLLLFVLNAGHFGVGDFGSHLFLLRFDEFS